jgi:3-dehydrotetronate 4-kinase
MLTSKPKLGCIADDFTGASDLANNLVRSGMRVVQTIGVPESSDGVDADAVVVALKSRTLPVAKAVAQSLQALHWLQNQGAQQIYFKYCSTFDSIYAGNQRGNIGPVTEALMEALGTSFTVATPAFPDNQRTVFKGHLFVGDELLADSGMRNHPLTPMTDSNLVRVMQAQCRGRVGLLDYGVINRGEQAISDHLAQLQAQGVSIAIVDAVSNTDLLILGRALARLPLVTAASGLALGLAANYVSEPFPSASELPPSQGAEAILSGSCSEATNAQVKHFKDSGFPAFEIDPVQLTRGVNVVQQVLDWSMPWLGNVPLLVYSTAAPTAVKEVQGMLGTRAASEAVENALANIARGLVSKGVGKLIIAGGETSGACVNALGITQMQVGMQITPGVPWCFAVTSIDHKSVHLVLKSGNFGAKDLFTQAFKVLT